MRLFCILMTAVMLSLGSFSVQAAADSLAAPELLSPKDKAGNQVPTTVLKWKEVPGAKAYRVVLSMSPDSFSSLQPNKACADCLLDQQVSATTYQVPKNILNKNKPYYWTVRAVNDAGEGPAAPARSYKLASVYFVDMD